MSHIHDLSCLRPEPGHPGCVHEPLEMICGFKPYPELTTEQAVKELGMHSFIEGWIGENVEFSEDSRKFRLKDGKAASPKG